MAVGLMAALTSLPLLRSDSGASMRAGETPTVVHLSHAAATSSAHLGVISGISYARGKAPSPSPARRAAAGSASCAEPNCPLVHHGGPVQHSPHVYLLLWGPSWSSDAGHLATKSFLTSFYSALGAQPSDTWSAVMSQSGDGTGLPRFTGSTYMGVFLDATTPPTGVNQVGLSDEADAFAANQGITDGVNAQVVIATQSGTCPEDFFASSCQGGSGVYCAWHSNSTVTYTNLPYLLDSGSGCGANIIQDQYDGFSIVGGHEYAETVTDPHPNSGWIDLNDSSGGENADKCAWKGIDTLTLSTGTFAMQPLFSNRDFAASGTGCAMSGIQPPATIGLVASATSTVATKSVTLTATAGASVTDTGYWIGIVDKSTGATVHSCTTGTGCATSVASGVAVSKNYAAEVIGVLGTVAATSPLKKITWAKQATTTLLGLSTGSVRFGSEQAERFSVTVNAQLSGPPGGSVQVRTGTRVLCRASLSHGKGSCTLSPRALAKGTSAIRAYYTGSSNYAPSASTAKNLRVT